MNGLALLFGTSLFLTLPRPTTTEAWSTELGPMGIAATGTEGFSPDTPPTSTVRA